MENNEINEDLMNKLLSMAVRRAAAETVRHFTEDDKANLAVRMVKAVSREADKWQKEHEGFNQNKFILNLMFAVSIICRDTTYLEHKRNESMFEDLVDDMQGTSIDTKATLRAMDRLYYETMFELMVGGLYSNDKSFLEDLEDFERFEDLERGNTNGTT